MNIQPVGLQASKSNYQNQKREASFGSTIVSNEYLAKCFRYVESYPQPLYLPDICVNMTDFTDAIGRILNDGKSDTVEFRDSRSKLKKIFSLSRIPEILVNGKRIDAEEACNRDEAKNCVLDVLSFASKRAESTVSESRRIQLKIQQNISELKGKLNDLYDSEFKTLDSEFKTLKAKIFGKNETV